MHFGIIRNPVRRTRQLPGRRHDIAPPAINLPAGAKVVTEVNLTDADVLGMLKASIPALADVLKSLAPSRGGNAAMTPVMLGQIDLNGLSEVISDIHGVRIVIAHYDTPIDPQTFIQRFSDGVAKLGQFSKLMSDSGLLPIAAASGLYVAPDNAGMIGFGYDPDQRQGSVRLPRCGRTRSAQANQMGGRHREAGHGWSTRHSRSAQGHNAEQVNLCASPDLRYNKSERRQAAGLVTFKEERGCAASSDT